MLGTAIATLPAAAMMRALGRRLAYLLGALASMAGGLLSAWMVWIGSFPGFVVAIGVSGAAHAFVQTYRFAATDTASPAFRPKAISWVLTGGVVAGIVGPQTVIWSKELTAPILFAGTFLAQALLAAIGFVVLLFFAPPPARTEAAATAAPARSTAEILSDRTFVVAVVIGVSSYALMNFMMTAGPIAMVGCGLTATDAAMALQWHVLAMFVPSFFTGSVIARFGVAQVIAVGLLLIAASGVVGLAGITRLHFDVALILLGLGWNFAYVGATNMIADLSRPSDRTKVQGMNEFAVFGAVAVASLSSGVVLGVSGWTAIVAVTAALALATLALVAVVARAPRAGRG